MLGRRLRVWYKRQMRKKRRDECLQWFLSSGHSGKTLFFWECKPRWSCSTSRWFISIEAALYSAPTSHPLQSQSFSDISVLCSYIHLQKLEVPRNKITGDFYPARVTMFPPKDSHFDVFLLLPASWAPLDLSCVSHMPFLVILDASHNEIADFFGFKPPKNLKASRGRPWNGTGSSYSR